MSRLAHVSDSLIARAKAGDSAALNRLMDAYRPLLRALAEASLGNASGSRADPSDVVQETLIYVAQSISDFRGTTREMFEAWLRQIVHHKATDIVRHHFAETRDVRREISLDDGSASGPALANQLCHDGSTPKQQAIRREDFSLALSSIRQENQAVLRLYLVEGMQVAQIAVRLGLPLDETTRRLLRGLRTLKRRLSLHGPGNSDESASERI